MELYVLEIISQPKIEFACSLAEHLTASSLNIIDHRENLIEIAVIEGADMLVDTGDSRMVLKDGNIRLNFPDKKYILRPVLDVGSDDVNIVSVAARIDEMKLERVEVKSEAEAAGLIESLPPEKILLPEELSMKKESAELFMLIMQSLISCRLDLSAAGRLKCLSLWYELISQLDSGLRSQIYSKLENDRKAPSSAYYHVYRMKKYISDHLSEELSVSGIAKAVGLSSDYAGKIFRHECGMSLSEFIAHSRSDLIRNLIRVDTGASLSEIAARAGFSDLRYAQRVFKRCTGITMLRCRQLNDGLTLWHSDPWQTNNLEHDIFIPNNKK